MYEASPILRRRAFVAAVLVQSALLALLLGGRGADAVRAAGDPVDLVLSLPAPPPAVPPPAHPRTAHRNGAASPPNLRSQATPVVAPPAIVPPVAPPPLIAALHPGTGAAPSAGAAEIRGPGFGSGGAGDGSGSGTGGDGEGDGGDETPPRLLHGRLNNADYPRAAGQAGIGGTVSVRYTVGIDGRVRDCRITRSSGNDDLDRTTCTLIVARFRFAPSRDANGNPVEADVVEDHSWQVQHD